MIESAKKVLKDGFRIISSWLLVLLWYSHFYTIECMDALGSSSDGSVLAQWDEYRQRLCFLLGGYKCVWFVAGHRGI